MRHSSFYALYADAKLSTFGRGMVSIQVMLGCPSTPRRTSEGSVSTFTLTTAPAVELTQLAVAIAARTRLLEQKQPAARSTWPFRECTGFLAGSDFSAADDDRAMSEVKALVSQALGQSDFDVTKVHLLLSGSIKGQVSSFRDAHGH